MNSASFSLVFVSLLSVDYLLTAALLTSLHSAQEFLAGGNGMSEAFGSGWVFSFSNVRAAARPAAWLLDGSCAEVGAENRAAASALQLLPGKL